MIVNWHKNNDLLLKRFVCLLFLSHACLAQDPTCIIAKEASIFSNGTLEYELLYQYNPDQTIQLKTENRSISGSTYQTQIRFTYNIKGLLSQEEHLLNGALQKTIVKIYDDRGKLLQETEKVNNVELSRVSLLANPSEKLLYEPNGTVSGREVEEKDAAGRLIKKELRNKDNQLYTSTELSYTATGEILIEKNIDVVGGLTTIKKNSYGPHGIRADSTIINGTPKGTTEYLYNEEGLLQTQKGYDAAGKEIYARILDYSLQGILEKESYFIYGELNSYKKFEYQNSRKIKEEHFNASNTLTKTKTWEYTCN